MSHHLQPAKRKLVVLMVDDDDDDYLLTKRALNGTRLSKGFRRVCDGEEMLDYLHRRGRYSGDPAAERPDVILLDLNMPRMDGRQALEALKSSQSLKDIPVVVFSTSKAEEDILRTYQLGVNSFITKPVTFDGLVAIMNNLGTYWFEVVELPRRV